MRAGRGKCRRSICAAQTTFVSPGGHPLAAAASRAGTTDYTAGTAGYLGPPERGSGSRGLPGERVPRDRRVGAYDRPRLIAPVTQRARKAQRARREQQGGRAIAADRDRVAAGLPSPRASGRWSVHGGAVRGPWSRRSTRGTAPRVCARRRSSYEKHSTRLSGIPRRGRSRSRSTGASARWRASPPTPATACTAGSSSRRRPQRWRSG